MGGEALLFVLVCSCGVIVCWPIVSVCASFKVS